MEKKLGLRLLLLAGRLLVADATKSWQLTRDLRTIPLPPRVLRRKRKGGNKAGAEPTAASG